MDSPVPANLISIVVPVLNEKESLPLLAREIEKAMQGMEYEILFIDDGSTDGSDEVLKELQKNSPQIKTSFFRRNYGKSAALACGFEHANGDYVVTLDADLQDDPNEIPAMLDLMQKENADLVVGWKKERRDPIHKIISSKLFNAAIRFLSGLRLHDFNCGLKVFRRDVMIDLDLYGELHRFIPALAHWKGYKVIEKPVHHRPRQSGVSKYGVARIIPGFADLMTVSFLHRYGRKPSHLFGTLGIVSFAAGTGINLHLLIIKLTGGNIAPHYPYMIAGILGLVVGLQLIFFGLLSEMIVSLAEKKSVYRLK